MKGCGKKDMRRELMNPIDFSSLRWIVICFTLFYFNCDVRSDNKSKGCVIVNETITPEFSAEEFKEFERKIILEGDANAYYYYLLHHYGPEMLQYSIIMACRYNYPRAYYDVYSHLIISLYGSNKIPVDSTVWNVAFDFLKKGANLKEINALDELHYLYKKGNQYIKPDSSKANYYKALAEEVWRKEKAKKDSLK